MTTTTNKNGNNNRNQTDQFIQTSLRVSIYRYIYIYLKQSVSIYMQYAYLSMYLSISFSRELYNKKQKLEDDIIRLGRELKELQKETSKVEVEVNPLKEQVSSQCLYLRVNIYISLSRSLSLSLSIYLSIYSAYICIYLLLNLHNYQSSFSRLDAYVHRASGRAAEEGQGNNYRQEEGCFLSLLSLLLYLIIDLSIYLPIYLSIWIRSWSRDRLLQTTSPAIFIFLSKHIIFSILFPETYRKCCVKMT